MKSSVLPNQVRGYFPTEGDNVVVAGRFFNVADPFILIQIRFIFLLLVSSELFMVVIKQNCIFFENMIFL